MAHPIPSYLTLFSKRLRSSNVSPCTAGESDAQHMLPEVWHMCPLVGTPTKLDSHSERWYVSNFLQMRPYTIQPSNPVLDSEQ